MTAPTVAPVSDLLRKASDEIFAIRGLHLTQSQSQNLYQIFYRAVSAAVAKERDRVIEDCCEVICYNHKKLDKMRPGILEYHAPDCNNIRRALSAVAPSVAPEKEGK